MAGIDWTRVLQDEGYEPHLYTLDNEKSGVTMLGGIDVGQGNKDKLYSIIDSLEIPADKSSVFKKIVDKVSGLKGKAAITAFNKLSNDERNTASIFLDKYGGQIQGVYNKNEETNIANTYNKIAGKTGIQFEELDTKWKNVIASTYHQYGAEGVSNQSLYGQIASGDITGAIKNLNNWGDRTDQYAESINNRYARYGAELAEDLLMNNMLQQDKPIIPMENK
jgi:hypothetical protein